MKFTITKNNKLRYLARLYGIAPGFDDYRGRYQSAPDEVLIALINIRGGHDFGTDIPLLEARDLAAKLKAEKIRKLLPETLVAWGGRLKPVWIWARQKTETLTLILTSDSGVVQKFDLAPAAVLSRKIKGKTCYRLLLDMPNKFAFGCYELRLETDRGEAGNSYLIAAPNKLKNEDYRWGGFAPVYALHDQKTGPVGGYRELKKAAAFTRKQGGDFIGTLPLLPLFYEGSEQEVSPYTPVSRLFWNELFLDLSKLPGVRNIALPKPQKMQNQRVDYDQSHAAVKEVLTKAANQFFEKHPDGDAGFKRYWQDTPLLESYARFRAKGTDDPDQIYRYHLYAQYACHSQLQDFKAAAAAGKIASLYLDHTVGVHPKGFDAACYQDDFFTGLTIGAPPDMMFRDGQNWGFHPLNPDAQIRDRFSYLKACFTHYFRYAKIVRIDHIMGLQRLYCIPVNDNAKQGSYLYYPLEAQLALLCLIAHQHDGILIGEDLGTVSKRIQTSMTRHGMNRMWVGQFALRRQWQKSFSGIRERMMACMNTHDMFPFRAFIDGIDIDHFVDFGMIDQTEAQAQHKQRAALVKNLKKEPDPYLACLEKMAGSKARYLMINFEDLWDETEPQNMPGIAKAYPNWQKKFSQSIDVWPDLPKVKQAVKILNQQRSHQK